MRVCEHPTSYAVPGAPGVERCNDCHRLHRAGAAPADREVIVEHLPDGRFKAEAWFPCGCGKVRHCTSYERTEELARLTVETHDLWVCSACGSEIARNADYCQETGCVSTYAHKGRCELTWIPPEVKAQLLAGRTAESHRRVPPMTPHPDALHALSCGCGCDLERHSEAMRANYRGQAQAALGALAELDGGAG